MDKMACELFQNEEFLKKVLVMQPEQAKAEFEKEGAEISLDEIIEIGNEINKVIGENGELDMESLDNVVGGGKWELIKFGAGIAVGIAVVCAPW